jgi:hypothetical protein
MLEKDVTPHSRAALSGLYSNKIRRLHVGKLQRTLWTGRTPLAWFLCPGATWVCYKYSSVVGECSFQLLIPVARFSCLFQLLIPCGMWGAKSQHYSSAVPSSADATCFTWHKLRDAVGKSECCCRSSLGSGRYSCMQLHLQCLHTHSTYLLR